MVRKSQQGCLVWTEIIPRVTGRKWAARFAVELGRVFFRCISEAGRWYAPAKGARL